MNDFYFKMWNDRKERVKHKQLNFAYYFELLEKLINCFDYENTPDGIDETFLEMYLLMNGTAGLCKSSLDDKYVCFAGSYCGDLNEYGIGKSYVGATCGTSYEYEIDKGGVVGLNNRLRTGRNNLLDRYSGLLANIEESMNVGIINTRLLDIIECADEKDVNQIHSINEQLKRGELTAVSSKMVSIFDENTPRFKKLDINDKNGVEKLQYYSRFYEDTLKRLWLESGIEITNKDKSAQVNVEELHSFTNYSRITIEDMLKCRENMCDDFNALYGTDWHVKLNHLFDNVSSEEDGVLNDVNVSRETSEETEVTETEETKEREVK